MARTRTISPLIWEDADFAQLSERARLTFIGLLNLADCEGRLQDDPRWIRIKLRPYEPEVDMDVTLEELAGGNGKPFVTRYEVDGVKCIQINNFLKYQKPHPNEKKHGSAFPSVPLTNNHERSRAIGTNQPSLSSISSVSSISSLGDSDSAEARIGHHPRYLREASDWVWFTTDDSIEWREGVVDELAACFPVRTEQLERQGRTWLDELRSLSTWHRDAPKSEKKRSSAQRWLFRKLFPKDERKAIHASNHRPPARAAARTPQALGAEPEYERPERKPCDRDHAREHITGTSVRYCVDRCGWSEHIPKKAKGANA